MGHYKIFTCDLCKLEFPEHMLTKVGPYELCGECLQSAIGIVIKESRFSGNRLFVTKILQQLINEVTNKKTVVIIANSDIECTAIFESFDLAIAIGFYPPGLNDMQGSNALAPVFYGIINNMLKAIKTDIALHKSVDRS